MRALFLLLAAVLLAGCSGDLRTHPIVRSPTESPKSTTSEDPLVTTEKELASAEFSRAEPSSHTWQKGTENGGIVVVLYLENGVKANVQYNRTDGNVRCEVKEPGPLLVPQILERDLVPTASQLIAKYGCRQV